jgi:Fe-S-cluster containining protein
LDHAARFPLAMSWTVVSQGTRNFALAAKLGLAIRVPKRRQIAVVISPTAYLPPTLPCPALNPEGRCSIHAHKPLRCRTMPFYGWREESDQADLLLPRQGWACDTSAAAPVVYQNRQIVDRGSFDLERRELFAQAATMRTYAEYALKYMPWIVENLAALESAGSGSLITSLSSFLSATKTIDAPTLATKQLVVLREFEARTSQAGDLEAFQRNYRGWAREMASLAKPRPE